VNKDRLRSNRADAEDQGNTTGELHNRLLKQARDAISAGEGAAACRLAGRLLRLFPRNASTRANAGGLLIDAGGLLRKKRSIVRGIAMTESVLPHSPLDMQGTLLYNAGNGYLALGQKEKGRSPGTRPSLARAISCLDQALALNDTPEARVNLASALLAQGRFPEALDELNVALTAAPKHPVALHKRADTYRAIYHWLHPHRGYLEAAYTDVEAALRSGNLDAVQRRVFTEQRERLQAEVGDIQAIEIPAAPGSGLVRFYWEHGLSLNMCPLCQRETPDAYDMFVLPAFLQAPGRWPPLSEVLDAVNSLQQRYVVARWCLALALGVEPIASHEEIPTLNASADASFSHEAGLLLLSVQALYGIFDQIAFTLNGYLRLGHDPRDANLRRIWRRRNDKNAKFPESRRDIHPRLGGVSAPCLTALYLLAASLYSAGGRYQRLRTLRNAVEHHGVVTVRGVHSVEGLLKKLDIEAVRTDALYLGRVCKAAVLYLGGALWKLEYDRLQGARRRGEAVAVGGEWPVRRT